MSIPVQEFEKSVVGIGGIGVYNEIHISNIERNKNEKVRLARVLVFETGTPASLVRWRTLPLNYPCQLISMVLLGKTTTYLPLQFLSSKKTHIKHIFTLSGPKQMPDQRWSQNQINRKERNYRNIFFFHWRTKMCEHRKNTELIFIKLHIPFSSFTFMYRY